MLEKPFKIWNTNLNGRHPKYTLCFHFWAKFTSGQPKILLKNKISTNTKFFGISNSVSPTSQKSHILLVKLYKKPQFCGPKLGLNYPLWPRQSVIRNSLNIYHRNIPLHVLDDKIQFLCICCSWLYLKKALRFFGLRPNWTYFVGFRGNNYSKQHQNELIFWPR